ncbi:peroxiredoxin [Rhodopseudomonas sp. P2A-2r]|uniref:peroxiredoxin n=1 Tax=unclassified Rhodopseudomonas TaxID=2638247 RepID=UPI0022344AF3|nr:peroxiredoxin [Rhodopseudomonas sp. P2A-2r]UZE52179.1 peroxiredoxin [Rhodopseudomonas sp. P2A-2r]
MSTKSRKNSSKAPTGKAPRAGAKAVTRKAAPAASKAAAKKTMKKAAKPAAKAAPKGAAKKSKAPAAKSAPTPARSKTAATKATAAKVAPKRAPAPKPAQAPGRAPAATAPAVAIEGALAPAFTLPRDGGASVALSDYTGRKLVIFFYPRASTPGCTREAIDFTRLTPEFSAVQTAILGVSADPLKAQESFRDKHDLTVPLLSDETHAMLESYGAWGEKSMYGKSFQGVFRTTVLIGKDGKVARIWRNVKVDGHAEEVLEAARQI